MPMQMLKKIHLVLFICLSTAFPSKFDSHISIWLLYANVIYSGMFSIGHAALGIYSAFTNTVLYSVLQKLGYIIFYKEKSLAVYVNNIQLLRIKLICGEFLK